MKRLPRHALSDIAIVIGTLGGAAVLVIIPSGIGSVRSLRDRPCVWLFRLCTDPHRRDGLKQGVGRGYRRARAQRLDRMMADGNGRAMVLSPIRSEARARALGHYERRIDKAFLFWRRKTTYIGNKPPTLIDP